MNGCVCVGFVTCGCFGKMCNCFYCVFGIVSFIYIYSYLFSVPVQGLLPSSDNSTAGSNNNNNNNNNNSKYKDLAIEIQRMWNVKTKAIPVITGATGTISKSFRKYVSNIPGKHEVKKLQKTGILGTAHTLRKSTNVKVQ